jgi:hypothetical protein
MALEQLCRLVNFLTLFCTKRNPSAISRKTAQPYLPKEGKDDRENTKLWRRHIRHNQTEAVDMNGRFQMQGGKNWILLK